MKNAERAIAIRRRLHDDAESQNVRELLEIEPLVLQLAPDGIGTLGPAADSGGDTAFGKLASELVGDARDAVDADVFELLDARDDGVQARLGLQFGEREVFQLLAHVLHADASGERRVDIDRLLRDAAALLGIGNEAQRAHVVQAVGELHQQHADIVRHRQHQLAEVFRLLGALAEEFELRQLGHAIDQARDLVPEILPHVLERRQRVLDGVVQQRGDDGRHIHLQVGQDGGDFERMGKVRIARGAELLSVRLHGVDIGFVEQILVGAGVIGLHPRDQFGLAHQLAGGSGCAGTRSARGAVQGESHPVLPTGLPRTASRPSSLEQYITVLAV